MPDELELVLVPPKARRWVSNEVPHDDGRVGRSRDEDLVVVLQTQDRAFVAAEDVRRLARGNVPHADCTVALKIELRSAYSLVAAQQEAWRPRGEVCRRTDPLIILRSSN